MKKSKVKFAVRKAMQSYYKSGLTNTAAVVRGTIDKAIDNLYKIK